jgi:hypothetical protein
VGIVTHGCIYSVWLQTRIDIESGGHPNAVDNLSRAAGRPVLPNMLSSRMSLYLRQKRPYSLQEMEQAADGEGDRKEPSSNGDSDPNATPQWYNLRIRLHSNTENLKASPSYLLPSSPNPSGPCNFSTQSTCLRQPYLEETATATSSTIAGSFALP